MSNAISTITNTLTNSPLPLLIEKLGLSIASAQSALDANSIAVAEKMASTRVNIDGKEYNLISLGFVPTFYAYTEASIEAKMDFSMTESESFEGSVSVGVNTEVVAVSISASYARKYEMSAEGSSSIAARMVSLPAPDKLKQLLTEAASKIPIATIELRKGSLLLTSAGTNAAFEETVIIDATVLPVDATDKTLIWELTPSTITPTNPTNTSLSFETPGANTTVTITAKSAANPSIKATTKIIVTNVTPGP
jgi:hypothetical protein